MNRTLRAGLSPRASGTAAWHPAPILLYSVAAAALIGPSRIRRLPKLYSL